MPYSAIKVANEFLRIASQENPPRMLTPLQLIKLVYIAHGWSLVYGPTPLLNEPIQAWQYGPVVPSLYHATKHFRSSPITTMIAGDTDAQALSPESRALIKTVYDSYGRYSGVQLSNMTHQPNAPWSMVWHQSGQNAIIPDEIILRHYVDLRDNRG